MKSTLLYLIIFSNLFFCNKIDLLKKEIKLENWELKIEGKWYKVGAVPWEDEVLENEKGGAGLKNFDGYGFYRIRFYLPLEFKNDSLAFYSDGMDDADETFLNERLIGKTGMIPENPEVSLKDFRSSAREARLYPLIGLNYGAENEITIKVYDYAGLGGFAPRQIPIIASFHTLQERERNHRLLNDLPRTIAGSFLLVFLFSYLFQFLLNLPAIKLKDVMKTIFFPYRFYFRTDEDIRYQFSIETYISSRYLLSSLFCFFVYYFY